MRQEVGRLALDFSWNTAVVAFGVNDCAQKRPLEDFTADTRGFLEALTSREGVSIYMLTPIPWLSGPEGNNLEEYREIIRKVAADFDQVTVIEGTDLVPAESKYFADGCHPNDAGMQVFAENLLARIK